MRINTGFIDIAALIDKKFDLLSNLFNSILAKEFDQIMPKNIEQIDLALFGFLHNLFDIAIGLKNIHSTSRIRILICFHQKNVAVTWFFGDLEIYQGAFKGFLEKFTDDKKIFIGQLR